MRVVFAFMFLMFSVFSAGCTKKASCDAAKVVSTVVSAQIVSQLDCKNLDAVKADLDEQLVKLNVCEKATSVASAAPKGALGDVICKPVIDALAGGALATLPAAWQCSGGQVTADVKAKILDACIKAL